MSSFDPEIIEARLSLELIASKEMPHIAWDALEAGFDGRAIRRLGALDRPTWFEVRDVLPQAMAEMGLHEITREDAAVRIAKQIAEEFLASENRDVKSCVRKLEWLWIRSGYSNAVVKLGTLDDELLVCTAGTRAGVC